ncbi:unnamed protein product [Rotaria socialis]|uniref:hydroxymethylbilane synthase n=2 Tax=Rotaria socialis TaxID=392032 RepID=A0A820HG06_9BILA|nr:unnamed protein product [Rotaria socialis]CAF3768860.1 unnamed protein product [Rotaria socialis]CAF4294478.1 unnamed protein product [Rotaria socialis]CAF4372154.1 unnamed protein product [Rotaria socialis]
MQYIPSRSNYKVGTRQSELALIQTESVIGQLKKFYPHVEYEVIKIKTIGDKNLLTPLANIGDKGLFTKELEIELDQKNIDFVIHSLKDVPSTTLPPNMVIGAILERADPRDAVIIAPWRQEKSLHELPAGSAIGTSSTRRIAQLKLSYPKLTFKNIRGNMNTRWEKLSNPELGYDAMIAAVAGFQRLNWADRISEIIEPDRVLYAIGQGALGIECRHDDNDTIRMLSVLNHEPTVVCCVAERAFLRRIEGGCSIPNAVHTEYNGTGLTVNGILLNLDGSRYVKDQIENSNLTVSMTTPIPSFLVSQTDDDLLLADDDTQPHGINLKRKRADSNGDDTLLPQPKTTASISSPPTTVETSPLLRHFAHVCCVNINETILENAELCGTNLAVKLMQMGAGSILEEIRQNVPIIPMQQ